MNRNRIVILSVVAILLGVVTSSFVYRQLTKATVAPAAPTGEIVVAATRIPLGTPLQAGQLRLIPWSSGSPVVGMFTRIEDCVNRVVTTAVIENEPILEGKLAPKDARGGLPAAIPEGMRALSVSVNDVVAVAGFALPGTVVDVLSTGSVEGGGGNSVTRTILENVRVLAAGQKIEQDKDGKPQTVPVITLLVTPQQATTLTMASTEGRIQLALRNTIDTTLTNPPPVFGATIFGGAPALGDGHPKVAGVQPKEPDKFVIEVIRGDKRETTTF